MDEYADIYYVDTRNADHRAPAPAGAMVPRPVPPQRTIVLRPPAGAIAYAPQPMYAAPQSPVASLLGNLTTGQVVEMVAQIFAALQGLPAAPIATKDVTIDVGNLMLYQGALAAHAKRDEQLRTLGSLVARLVG